MKIRMKDYNALPRPFIMSGDVGQIIAYLGGPLWREVQQSARKDITRAVSYLQDGDVPRASKITEPRFGIYLRVMSEVNA